MYSMMMRVVVVTLLGKALGMPEGDFATDMLSLVQLTFHKHAYANISTHRRLHAHPTAKYAYVAARYTTTTKAACNGPFAKVAPSLLTCESNDWHSSWRNQADCTKEIADRDQTTWGNDKGVHFTEWAVIGLPGLYEVSQVKVYHYIDNKCPYEVQYALGYSHWMKACSMTDAKGTAMGTCLSGFPSTSITRLRIRKSPSDNCWSAQGHDKWYRLTGVEITGRACDQAKESYFCTSGEGQLCVCVGTVYYGRKFVSHKPGSGAMTSLQQILESNHKSVISTSSI
jgi:hypothetical protein